MKAKWWKTCGNCLSLNQRFLLSIRHSSIRNVYAHLKFEIKPMIEVVEISTERVIHSGETVLQFENLIESTAKSSRCEHSLEIMQQQHVYSLGIWISHG